jgi:hypothetical protein
MSLLQRLALAVADQWSPAAPCFTVVPQPTGVDPRRVLAIACRGGAT